VLVRRHRLPIVIAAIAVVLAACNDDGRTLRPARPDQNDSVSTSVATTLSVDDGGIPLTLPPTLPPTTAVELVELAMTAPWEEGGTIDAYYTCDGAGVSPALVWTPAPAGTQEIAVTLVDETTGALHWVMAGIDPLATSLLESEVPEFATLGVNSVGQTAYFAPCPPTGETHVYRVSIHALAQRMELGDGADGAVMVAAIEGSAFLTGSVSGSYSRP
jgi:Raf kinase inhibitor-like YbhB/YbcL family protein